MASTLFNSTPFTTEQQLTQRFNNEIKALWHKGTFDYFAGVNDTRINYAAFVKNSFEKNAEINNDNRRCVVIVPGRSEGYLKYQELTFDLYQQGYDIFIIDHRGQGLSERLLPNRHKGYVDSFDDYSADLHVFIEQIVSQHCPDKPYLLAHSMGGIIAARYLQKHPEAIKAAVLSSPMIAINGGGFPKWLTKVLINSAEQLNQWLSNEAWYFLGQSDIKEEVYQVKNFSNNPLMQSQVRYQKFTQLYQSIPEIQLGGVTVHWLAQALKAENEVFDHLKALVTPTLVLQASADSIVDNFAQDKFCLQLNKHHPKSCPNGRPIVIEHARHELFFEADQYRAQAIQHMLTWFDEN